MACCEKCWKLADGRLDAYNLLIKTKKCTPEEQAGKDATDCPICVRRTVHQYAKFCVVCGWEEKGGEK